MMYSAIMVLEGVTSLKGDSSVRKRVQEREARTERGREKTITEAGVKEERE